MLLICTAPIPERERLADEALTVSGVVDVREIATGSENVMVTVVAADAEELTAAARRLVELGLTIGEEELIRGDRATPFDGFASVTAEAAESADADES
jgi:hypothetical protein